MNDKELDMFRDAASLTANYTISAETAQTAIYLVANQILHALNRIDDTLGDIASILNHTTGSK